MFCGAWSFLFFAGFPVEGVFFCRHPVSSCFCHLLEGSVSGLILELFGPSFQTCAFESVGIAFVEGRLFRWTVDMCLSSSFDGISRSPYLLLVIFRFSGSRFFLFVVVPVPTHANDQHTRKVFRLSRDNIRRTAFFSDRLLLFFVFLSSCFGG